jgi:streptogramin lyase
MKWLVDLSLFVWAALMKLRRAINFALAFWVASVALGQRPTDYDSVVVLQTRIDARDLGYSPLDLIPDGESGITSLSVAPDGDLYGATSGNRSHLFVMNPLHGYVQPLGIIPGATAVTNALVVSAVGEVYIGTSPQGHLLKYRPADADGQQIQIEKQAAVVDLGEAVYGESISALTIDRNAGLIYGLTSPNTHFFEYSIATGKFSDLGTVAKQIPLGESFEKEKMMSRMLVVDMDGNVFASGENGSIYEFESKTRTLEKLPIRAPAIPGRQPWTRVDAFVLDPSGVIYGGTSDGYLFRLDPRARTVVNLGKPLNQYRIAGLVRGPDGKLYGVGGEKDELARLFCYDPSSGVYDLLGLVDVNRRPYYNWQAEVVGTLASDSHGTIYLGENERVSKLYLFYP